jgi:two-component system, sensor histidine kinase LadS
MRFLCLALFFLLQLTNSYGQTTVFQIDNDTIATYRVPKTAVRYFVDTIGNKDLNYVLQNPQLWQTIKQEQDYIQVANVIQNYWTVFDIENITPLPIEILVNINSFGKNYYYLLDTANTIIHEDISGDLATWNEKKGFKISQEASFVLQATQKYRLVTHHFKLWQVKRNTKIEFPITIANAKKKFRSYYFVQRSTKTGFLATYFGGFAVGIIFVMVFYNLFIYFSVGDRSYLYYVAFLLPTGIFFMYQQDFTNIILFPNLPIFEEYLRTHYIFIVFVFYIKFTQSLLTTKLRFPRLHQWLTLLLVLECVMHSCNVANFYIGTPNLSIILFNLSDILLVLIVVSCMITGVVALIAKYSPAKYYLLACSLAATGTIIFIVAQSIQEDIVITKYLMQGGVIAMIVLFSLSLSDRINLMKKEITQKELEKETQRRQLVEQQTTVLEEQVQIRTLQLRETNNTLNQTNEELNVTLEKMQIQANEITQQNADITASITYANRIQTAMLPTNTQLETVLKEYFVFFRPRNIVSGDFYYLGVVRADEQFNRQMITDKVIIAALDCTGHGVPGAFMSLIGNEVLNEIISSQKITKADQILNLLHKGVKNALRQTDSNNQDGMDVALCVLAKANEKLIYLEFAGANNPLYYVHKNVLQEIKGDKMPIGGSQYHQQNRLFTAHQIDLETLLAQGAMHLYLCSDGYQDQFGGKEGRKFMLKQLKELFLAAANLPIMAQQTMIATTFDNWKHDHKQVDDVLVIGIKLQAA